MHSDEESIASPSLDLENDGALNQSSSQASANQERDGPGNVTELNPGSQSGPQSVAVQNRDPPMERSWLCHRGARIARWIEDPTEPQCPIPQRSLTFEQVDQGSLLTEIEEVDFPPSIEAGLENIPSLSQDKANGKFFTARFNRRSIWSGTTGPNVLILENIERDPSETSQPQISEISLALYTRDYPVEDLRYVFVTIVVNHQTKHYLDQCLYDSFPSDSWCKPRTWEHGTQEYTELLGTRIGRTVGYIVLGAFRRGSHRIARILTWSSGGCWDFRFDIEPVSSSD